MNLKKLSPILFVFLFSGGPENVKPQGSSVSFLSEQVFEKNKKFQELKVGGLSELFFDKSSGYFFALSDDKKNHRFYKMSLKKDPYQLKIEEQIFLKDPGGERLKRNMDPEAMVFYGKDKIFIASEGQQIFEIHEPTQIFTFDRQAVLRESWPVPSVFWKHGVEKQSSSFGQQENKGFESLTLNKKSNLLWTATEKPLKQDLIFQGKSYIRISSFEVKSKKMTTQYPYLLKNGSTGGLVALEWLKPKIFLSLERAYKKNKGDGVNEVHLFITNCRSASNIKSQVKIEKQFTACNKKLIWESSKDMNFKPDNLEGMTLGPNLISGNPLLILLSDNNFNEKKQKTQFVFFELNI